MPPFIPSGNVRAPRTRRATNEIDKNLLHALEVAGQARVAARAEYTTPKLLLKNEVKTLSIAHAELFDLTVELRDRVSRAYGMWSDAEQSECLFVSTRMTMSLRDRQIRLGATWTTTCRCCGAGVALARTARALTSSAQREVSWFPSWPRPEIEPAHFLLWSRQPSEMADCVLADAAINVWCCSFAAQVSPLLSWCAARDCCRARRRAQAAYGWRSVS